MAIEMLSKTISLHDFVEIDEGWWSSILADDEENDFPETNLSSRKEENNKPANDWQKARSLFERDAIIELPVAGSNRGGLLIQGDDLSGFVPCSHLLTLPYHPSTKEYQEYLASYAGRKLRLKLIEVNEEEGKLVFSERAAQTEEGRRPNLFNTIKVGQIVTGSVTNVTNFGVFIDLGGVEGLIHISELSWGRVNQPGEICQIGQQIQAQVIEVIPERCRIALSIKRCQPNPWIDAQDKYPLNEIVPAVVSSVVPYGIFARLEEGLEGLVHLSEIDLPAESNLHCLFSKGQKIQVRILQVESSRQRLGLSLKLDHYADRS
jgi:small subunit ribosomal protein S1